MPHAYTRRIGALALGLAVAAVAMHPRVTSWTRGGLTVIARSEPTAAVVVEAWVGGGHADLPLAHLAEHVAIAQAEAAGLDGRTTPDAVIVRGRGRDLAAALGPVWRAITATRVDPAVLDRERRAVRAEGAAARGTAAAVEAHWRTAWRGQRATLVVHGAVAPAEIDRWLAPWPGQRRLRGPRAPRHRQRDRLVVPGPAPLAAAAPAAAIAAAASGRASLVSGRFVIDLGGPLRWPDADDRAAWAAARATAAAVPIAAADGWVGVAAAAQHVAGDLRWPARYRAAVAATPDAEVQAAAVALERAVGEGRRRRWARPAPASAISRTTRGATRLAVARGDHATVAVRWTWALGADTDATIGLAAAALARCLDDLALDARGGRAEVIVERDRLGIRGEFDPAAWRDGVRAIVGCVAAPDRSSIGHARDHARLTALAAAVAGSPIRRGLAAFATATYGEHALAAALAPTLPLLGPDDVLAWWAARRAAAAAVVAAVGPVELAELAPLIVGDPLRPRAVRGGRPMVPPAPELFVDGRPGERAIVIGFDALTAGDRDRAALDALAILVAAPDGPLARALPGARLRVAVADAVDAGYLAIAIDHPPDAAAAVAAARAALAALVARPPSAAQVAAALAAVAPPTGSPARRAADALAAAELVGAPAAVDAAAVARLVARVLAPARAVVVTVRPPDETPAVERRRRAARHRRGRSGR
jgi:hypothetical protein